MKIQESEALMSFYIYICKKNVYTVNTVLPGILNMGERNDFYHYKTVLLGSSGAGKTSLSSVFMNDTFPQSHTATIGADFASRTVRIDNRSVKLDVWDTAGQEKYKSLTPMYYRNASAAVVVYDITSKESLDKAKDWIKEVKKRNGKQTLIALTGQKADLEQEREVDKKTVEEFAEKNGYLYFETSAKMGKNVEEMFSSLTKALIERKQQSVSSKPMSLDLETAEKGFGCC
eukprot:maker-scaffold_8-snap-gene-6.8-mRNA-1 protein AED:0.05 eAED:0.05 QI:0/0.66/0.5/0.75/1/1/4/758/230